MGGGVVYCCLCHYELHNYDKEVVKLVLGILKQLEDKIFQQNKLIVRCDKNLSWYSFEKIRKNCDNNEP